MPMVLHSDYVPRTQASSIHPKVIFLCFPKKIAGSTYSVSAESGASFPIGIYPSI